MTSAADILANYRRARSAVRGGASAPVIVPLPDQIPGRVEGEESVAAEPVLRRPPTIRAIIAAVAAEYGVSPLDIVSARRMRGITLPRQVAMYLARHYTTRSLAEIGRRMGKDHTSVLWGVRVIAAKLAASPAIEVDRTTTLAALVAAHRIALENEQ